MHRVVLHSVHLRMTALFAVEINIIIIILKCNTYRKKSFFVFWIFPHLLHNINLCRHLNFRRTLTWRFLRGHCLSPRNISMLLYFLELFVSIKTYF